MKKKILLIVAVLTLIIIGILIFFLLKDEDYNKKLELTVDTNGGVPYKWEYEIEDGNIVKFVNSYVIDDKNTNGKVGAKISMNYVFEGVNPGKTKIILKYVNITDNKVEKEEIFNVRVNNKKGISLLAIDK